MRTRLRITDTTRMSEPHVCIAGYSPDGACVRPVLAHGGIEESSLTVPTGTIEPFAVVDYDLRPPAAVHNPHTEDRIYDASSVQVVGVLNEAERRALLRATLTRPLAELFGAPLITIGPGPFVRSGTGARSLGTIHPAALNSVVFYEKEGRLKTRLVVRDSDRHEYSLPVTDLAWHYFTHVQQRYHKGALDALARQWTRTLQQRELYLRVGLTREFPSGSHQCWVQVTGIHTFPDYLEGAHFTDYRAGLVSLERSSPTHP